MGPDTLTIQPPVPSKSTSSFAYSFTFLPQVQRSAIKTVYAFCRTTDDLVDNDLDPGRKMVLLQSWRAELEKAIQKNSSHELLNQLCTLAERFHIPINHFHDLIRGAEMDLIKNRYETFGELKEYCYLVASSVGLMTLGIFGSKQPSTREYAVNLGIALQLTNIIRDVGVDAKAGRIYLPLEDLRRFGCREEDILAGKYTQEFRMVMECEALRADAYFDLARQALAPEDRKAMFAARIMERIYVHTLRKIRKSGYNVFDGEIRIPSAIRFLIACKYWFRDRILAR